MPALNLVAFWPSDLLMAASSPKTKGRTGVGPNEASRTDASVPTFRLVKYGSSKRERR